MFQGRLNRWTLEHVDIQGNGTGRGTNSSNVVLTNADDALAVVKRVNGQEWYGKILKVNLASEEQVNILRRNSVGISEF